MQPLDKRALGAEAPMDEAADPPAVLAVIDDLILETRIRGAAQAAGVGFRSAATMGGLETVLAQRSWPLVTVDMECRQLDPAAAIGTVKARCKAMQVIAFYPHVQRHLAEAALQAGADEALARSKFVAVLPELVQKHAVGRA